MAVSILAAIRLSDRMSRMHFGLRIQAKMPPTRGRVGRRDAKPDWAKKVRAS